MLVQVTLSIRPSLAFPARWSVDYWFNDHREAAYQASLVTYTSPELAEKFADQIQAAFQARGATVQRLKENENASRHTIAKPQESEEEIQKGLVKHIEKTFEPLRKFSIANLFDISNWTKGLKAIATHSPHALSLLVLLALFFGGPVEDLLSSILPTQFAIKGSRLLATSPLLIAITALFHHFRRANFSSQLDRVRLWILQLTVFFGWGRDRFMELLLKEWQQLEYASVTNLLQTAVQRDPRSITNLTMHLATGGEKLDQEEIKNLTDKLIGEDFARKIQALAGVAGEPDYRPKHLAISPLLLLISLRSVETTMLGILDGKTGAIQEEQRFAESNVLIGTMLAVLLSLAMLLPALVWTTVRSWSLSPVLFAADLVASLLTVWLLTARSLAVVFQRKFVPRGLFLNDCIGTLIL